MKGTEQVLRLVFGGKIVQFDHVTELIDVYRRVAIKRKISFRKLLINVYYDKLFLSLCDPSIVQKFTGRGCAGTHTSVFFMLLILDI